MSQRPSSPLRAAIVGIGGFGAAHHAAFEALEGKGEARVVATCDPALDKLGDLCRVHRFEERGIRVYRDLDSLLAAHEGELDLGVVTTPIPLHAPMHEQFVQRGVACYLEKPPTLTPDEFEQMLVVERSASVSTQVGFCYVNIPERIQLKRRILSGEFGALRRVSLLGLAPRSVDYFARNNWAGKLLMRDQLLLDSCLGNAMAHMVNNLLYFSGTDSLDQRARPVEMQAELYRANAIEGADTIFAIGRLRNGVEIRLAGSHACASEEALLEEILEFEQATITIRGATQVSIQGVVQETFSIPGVVMEECVRSYLELLRAERNRAVQTLEDSRGFIEANALFYLAGQRIHGVPGYFNKEASVGPRILGIPEIVPAARQLVRDGLLPSQAGYSWARSAGQASIESLPALADVVRRMHREVIEQR